MCHILLLEGSPLSSETLHDCNYFSKSMSTIIYLIILSIDCTRFLRLFPTKKEVNRMLTRKH